MNKQVNIGIFVCANKQIICKRNKGEKQMIKGDKQIMDAKSESSAKLFP